MLSPVTMEKHKRRTDLALVASGQLIFEYRKQQCYLLNICYLFFYVNSPRMEKIPWKCWISTNTAPLSGFQQLCSQVETTPPPVACHLIKCSLNVLLSIKNLFTFFPFLFLCSILFCSVTVFFFFLTFPKISFMSTGCPEQPLQTSWFVKSCV